MQGITRGMHSPVAAVLGADTTFTFVVGYAFAVVAALALVPVWRNPETSWLKNGLVPPKNGPWERRFFRALAIVAWAFLLFWTIALTVSAAT